MTNNRLCLFYALHPTNLSGFQDRENQQPVKVMDDTFVSLTNVFTSANDDRIACIDNLNNIIYKAGWNDPSKKKIYADLLKRFKNDEADMRNVLNVYNYIRAVDKERSIYIVL
jgi:hypothetical protein